MQRECQNTSDMKPAQALHGCNLTAVIRLTFGDGLAIALGNEPC
jgi:hypothetical protein